VEERLCAEKTMDFCPGVVPHWQQWLMTKVGNWNLHPIMYHNSWWMEVLTANFKQKRNDYRRNKYRRKNEIFNSLQIATKKSKSIP